MFGRTVKNEQSVASPPRSQFFVLVSYCWRSWGWGTFSFYVDSHTTVQAVEEMAQKRAEDFCRAKGGSLITYDAEIKFSYHRGERS